MVRILIVEDEFIFALAMQKKLLAYGFEVCETVATGEEAIRLTEALRPDLILMDIGLAGEMNGIDAAREILKNGGPAIIFISGYTDLEIESEARQLSSNGYLVKPVIFPELKSLIDIALNKHPPNS